MIIVVMGVSGVGKSTVGSELAQRKGCKFIDADDYHSAENKRKMHAGIPLTDEDRLPWLQTLNEVLRKFADQQQCVVLACSALKDSYRELLGNGISPIWVYLKGSPETIRERLTDRHGHFVTGSLLSSQLATLEEPANAITVDADPDPATIVDEILRRI